MDNMVIGNLPKTTEVTHDTVIQQINNQGNTKNLSTVYAELTSSEETSYNMQTNAQPAVEVQITSCDKDDDNICNKEGSKNNQINNDSQPTTDNPTVIEVHDDINDRHIIKDTQSTDVQQTYDQEDIRTIVNEQIATDEQVTDSHGNNTDTHSNVCNTDEHLRSGHGFANNSNKLQNSEENNESTDNCFPSKLRHDAGSYFEPDVFKRSKIDLYAEDTGPKLYTVKSNNVTPTLIPNNLPEAFKYLPVYGRPKTKANMKDFLNHKIKEFVGGGLNDEEFEQLSKECSADKLKTGNELVMPSSVPSTGLLPPNLCQTSDSTSDELCTVKKHKLRVKTDKKNVYQKRLKYRSIRILPVPQEDYLMDSDDHSPLQPGKDLVFHLRFYRPFHYNPLEKQVHSRHSLLSCDMVLLGRQTLETLRDRVACASDVVMRVDVSHDPDNLPPNTAKDLFPSGFLFINNTFYVDGREGCADTSLCVRDWAVKRGIGLFPHRDMTARLDQLPIKLGHPEVYVHQGNCEHLFTFSDVRLLNSTDPLNISQYPYHTSVGQNQTVYCTSCAEFGAKWIVVGCSQVPFNSSFFCDTCFRMYFYKGKEKIGDFKAYSYRGNELNILKPQAPFGAGSMFNFKSIVSTVRK